MSVEELIHFKIETIDCLRNWFSENYAQKESIWLVTYKKSVPEKYVANTDIIDQCICFGWMDGRKKKVDNIQTKQLLSPKKVKHWSKTYKDRYYRLKKTGKMHHHGELRVSEANESGDWDFMNDVDALVLPPDLQQAFRMNKQACLNYDAFPSSAKRDILRWVKLAKTAETREKRIREVLEKAARNQRASSTGKK